MTSASRRLHADVPGLIELLGGKDGFVHKLDTLFSMTSDFKVGGYGQVIHEMTESKMAGTGQYAHINEPVHHVIYLYNYAGQPWKAQRWVREIMDRFYRPGPDGWLAGGRGHRPDVGLVHFQRDGFLSGESGPACLRAGEPFVRSRGNSS
jgi:putative alpha-1,2-mannosidase